MRLKAVAVLSAVFLLGACAQQANDDTADMAMGGGEDQVVAAAPTTTVVPMGPAPGTAEDLVVNVGDRVFFALDRSDLSPEARATLERQAQWLRQYPSVRITVEGHADERGTREYNLALGDRRANSVRNYLIALGIDPTRINTVSYGKERPAVLGSNEQAWAQNRRGVTVLN